MLSPSISHPVIIILDTNGEYRDAFLADSGGSENGLKDINAYYYGGDGQVKVPYWLMNWQEFKALLKPGEGTQAPVLNRAISFAKNQIECSVEGIYSDIDIHQLMSVVNIMKSPEYWKIRNYKEAFEDWEGRNIELPTGEKLIDVISEIPNRDSATYNVPKPSEIEKCTKRLESFILGMQSSNARKQVLSEKNVDLPTWFSYRELCTKFLDAAITEQERGNARISDFVSTLRLRMHSFLNDNRMAIPLMLKDENECNRKVLPHFLALLLGDYNAEFSSTSRPEDRKNDFVEVYNKINTTCDQSRTNQITVVDVSLLPFEVLETVTALLGRIILEFVSNFMPEERGTHPIVIVLEEAQNYIAEKEDSVAKRVFERIAREGRKFGISLIVSSQRPSELSKTVLSQCNSFVIHRLQNPEDQKYVRGLVSSASMDILDQLPILPQRHAIVTGDCVRTPIQVRIDKVSPTPNSHDPEFIKNWLNKDNLIPYETTCKKWIGDEESQCEASDASETLETSID